MKIETIKRRIKALEVRLDKEKELLKAECSKKRSGARMQTQSYSAFCGDCREWHYYPKKGA